MESNYNKKSVLLPHNMKLIGIIISALAFVIGVAIKAKNAESENSDLIALFTYTGMILGLLFVSLSREKVEDERVDRLRAQSMQFAFVFAAISTIIRPMIDLIFGDPVEMEQAHSVVFMMLLVYNIFFLFLKKRG